MKRIFFVVCAAAVLTASGCSSMNNPQGQRTVEVVDDQRVQAIEHAAQRVNLKVIWVNQPTKRIVVESVKIVPADSVK